MASVLLRLPRPHYFSSGLQLLLLLTSASPALLVASSDVTSSEGPFLICLPPTPPLISFGMTCLLGLGCPGKAGLMHVGCERRHKGREGCGGTAGAEPSWWKEQQVQRPFDELEEWEELCGQERSEQGRVEQHAGEAGRG